MCTFCEALGMKGRIFWCFCFFDFVLGVKWLLLSELLWGGDRVIRRRSPFVRERNKERTLVLSLIWRLWRKWWERKKKGGRNSMDKKKKKGGNKIKNKKLKRKVVTIFSQ